MKNRNVLYIIFDIIFVTGILVSYFVMHNTVFVPLFIAVLLMTLMHQKYDEKKYFSGMFDQGRSGAIQGWTFTRWVFIILALVGFISLFLPY